jgi:hypothetical protein
MEQNVANDDYNKVNILIMQGVDGGLRAALHLMSIHALLWGSWRDTRRGCTTARTPRSLLHADILNIIVINMSERSCDVISNPRRHFG